MSANTFTLEAAAAANIQVVGSDKGSHKSTHPKTAFSSPARGVFPLLFIPVPLFIHSAIFHFCLLSV